MPQLMPLNWMISSIMVFLIIFSSCVIYSEELMNNLGDSNKKNFEGLNMFNWCW